MRDLAKVMYEAYCQNTGGVSLVSGAKLPVWEDLRPEIQDAWSAAAKASDVWHETLAVALAEPAVIRRYRVYAGLESTVCLGVYEAATQTEAIDIAIDDPDYKENLSCGKITSHDAVSYSAIPVAD
jgi:hypothetical protein